MLAQHFLDLLRGSKITEDRADGFVKVASEALLDDLAALLSLPDLLDWIHRGPVPTLAVAGELLGRRTESMTDLGLERLTMLAQHDIAAIRSGAHQLLRKGEAFLEDDPAVLLVLVESISPDTRKLAIELLRTSLRPETLSLDGLLGFLDSNETEVQNLAQDWTRRHLATLSTDKLVFAWCSIRIPTCGRSFWRWCCCSCPQTRPMNRWPGSRPSSARSCSIFGRAAS